MLFLIICNIYDNLSALEENANNKKIYIRENVSRLFVSFYDYLFLLYPIKFFYLKIVKSLFSYRVYSKISTRKI